jgi:hypothetical protein
MAAAKTPTAADAAAALAAAAASEANAAEAFAAAAAPAASAAPAAAGAKGQTISVRGPEDGRWRAGIHFGPIAITVDLSTITAAQLAAIEADAKLSVKRS